jgi:hypothetical protein
VGHNGVTVGERGDPKREHQQKKREARVSKSLPEHRQQRQKKGKANAAWKTALCSNPSLLMVTRRGPLVYQSKRPLSRATLKKKKNPTRAPV